MTIGRYAPRVAAVTERREDPRGYDPLVAGREFMPRPRKESASGSERWKREVSFPSNLILSSRLFGTRGVN